VRRRTVGRLSTAKLGMAALAFMELASCLPEGHPARPKKRRRWR
jgi:hypothetical protein